eukprot:g5321.t1
MDFKQLREEREARRRSNGSSRHSYTKPYMNSRLISLQKAHRSIRMAHSFGLCLCVFGVLFSLLFSVRFGLLCVFLGTGLARGGGIFVHNYLLPKLLLEGKPPSSYDISAAQELGLFSIEGLKSAFQSLSHEYVVLLENLAFACTYGKRNCLTNQMYTGPITASKIFNLVWGKVSQGIFNCA